MTMAKAHLRKLEKLALETSEMFGIPYSDAVYTHDRFQAG